MSSNKLHELSNMVHVQRVNCFVVQIGRKAIADYVAREIVARGWSYGEIVRRSGGHIKSASTLVNIVNGNVQKVSEDTLRGLAAAFEVKPDEVFAVYYGGNSRQTLSPTDFYSALEAMGVEQFQAYGGVENLTDEDRQEIIGVVGALIEQKLLRRSKAGSDKGGKGKKK